MLLFPDKLDTTLFTTDHTSGEPYVMWAGTPYEHIMMPVQAGDMNQSAAKIANALSGGPAPIVQEATIMDWPEGWPGNWPDEP